MPRGYTPRGRYSFTREELRQLQHTEIYQIAVGRGALIGLIIGIVITSIGFLIYINV